MRNKLTVLLFIFCFGMIGCQQNEEQYDERTLPPVGGGTVTRMPVHRGIYVNSFTTILGNSSAETALLTWGQTHLFNRLNLYNLGTLLPGASSSLNAFMAIAKVSPYFMKVSAVVSGTTSMNAVTNYWNAGYLNQPNSVTSEYEFWN